jgi:hypothetical protein
MTRPLISCVHAGLATHSGNITSVPYVDMRTDKVGDEDFPSALAIEVRIEALTEALAGRREHDEECEADDRHKDETEAYLTRWLRMGTR